MRNTNSELLTGHKSILFWLVISFTTALLFIAPFHTALFNGSQQIFDGPIYSIIMWSAIVLIIVALVLFMNWKIESHRDILMIAIWLIPICYMISTYHAVSAHLQTREIQLHIVYAMFFMIGAYFAGNRLGSIALKFALVLSGYSVAIYGMMNWFGNANFNDAIVEGRMSSVFQYPNSYAAYLIAILFACITVLINSKRWYAVILHAFMLVPLFLSFLLTLSRGGLVVLPIVLVVYLFFFSWRKQLVVLLYLAIAVGISFMLTNFMTEIRESLEMGFSSSASLRGWMALIVASTIVSLVIFVVHKFIAIPFINRKPDAKILTKTNFYLPLFFTIVGGILIYLLLSGSEIVRILPEGLRERVENVSMESRSVSTRGSYITDSLKIAKDYPVIGAGGGAWANLYNQYKSYPYISQQTHTVYLQFLVETGVLGISVFILLLGYVLFVFFRNLFRDNEIQGESDRRQFDSRLIYTIFSFTILVHSAIDFDMSFAYLSIVVFLGLGIMVSRDRQTLFHKSQIHYGRFAKVFSIVLVSLALFMFVEGVKSFRAHALFSEALHKAETTSNYNEIARPLDVALKLRPGHPEYNLYKVEMLIQLYTQTKAEEYANEAASRLKQMQALEPYNRLMFELQYAWFMAKDDREAALEWVKDGLEKFPWETSLYERTIILNTEFGYQVMMNHSDDEMNAYWTSALYYYEQFHRKNEEIRALPRSQHYGFLRPTPNMVFSIAQIYYMQGNYDQTITLIEPYTGSDDESIARFATRWFLSANLKLNKDVQKELESYIDKYPAEQQQIEHITGINL